MQNSFSQTDQSMLTYEDLVNDMAAGCKPRENWRIGIEHEQFLYNLKTGEPLPYDGKPGIKQVLENFARMPGWVLVEKNGYLIELQRNGASITLEPGGQFELSGAPYRTLAEMKTEADQFYSELHKVAEKLGIGVLPRGFHPTWRRDQIHWMPKERYEIMGPYMASKSKHGVDMMIRTCGAQVNLDFGSEADMILKYRVGLGLQPLITALMANSGEVEGQKTAYKSFRSFIWTETDADRTGVPAFIFSDEMSFARYVDWALDVPMYFIMRDGHHVNVAGQSFRDFMSGKLKGHEGDYPSIDDWHDHLTTLFPEVRLKTYLEFRGPDSTEPAKVYAMAAFWAGIYYNETALQRAADLIKGWTAADHARIRADVPRLGLETRLPDGKTLRDLAPRALTIAAEGLAAFEPAAVRDLEPFHALTRNF